MAYHVNIQSVLSEFTELELETVKSAFGNPIIKEVFSRLEDACKTRLSSLDTNLSPDKFMLAYVETKDVVILLEALKTYCDNCNKQLHEDRRIR
jgi:hypothetical protein